MIMMKHCPNKYPVLAGDWLKVIAVYDMIKEHLNMLKSSQQAFLSNMTVKEEVIDDALLAVNLMRDRLK
jgi:hypothetical protein